MNYEDMLQRFVGQYVLLLNKYRRELLTRGYEKVYEKIKVKNIFEIFYLYCIDCVGEKNVQYDDLKHSVMKFLECTTLEATCSVPFLNVTMWIYGKERGEGNFYFILLLLGLELARIDGKIETFEEYVVKIPINVFRQFPNNAKSLSFIEGFKIETALSIIEQFFECYSFVFDAIEHEEDRSDFGHIKTYYEMLFLREKYRVKQWQENKL